MSARRFPLRSILGVLLLVLPSICAGAPQAVPVSPASQELRLIASLMPVRSTEEFRR